MSQQHLDAMALIGIFRHRLAAGEGTIHGYNTAAELIKRNGDTDARYMGQVASRVDVACFLAGLPLLAVHMLRKPDGEINPASFPEGWWGDLRQEIIDRATTHHWTNPQWDIIIGELNALPDRSAKAIWEGIDARESKTPGFLRYNLHRILPRFEATSGNGSPTHGAGVTLAVA